MTNTELDILIRKADLIEAVIEDIKNNTISDQTDATFFLTVVHKLMRYGKELQEKVLDYQFEGATKNDE